MVVVGIDPGICNCGVAVVNEGRVTYLATFSGNKQESPYAFLYHSLQELFKAYRPNVAIVEGAFQASHFANPHIEAIGIIKAVAGEERIPISTYSPSAWKKILLGDGWMKKGDVLASMQRAGYGVRSTHEADALALALTYLKVNG